MYRGKLFHNFGPATENALSPLIFSFTRGTTKSKWSVDLEKDIKKDTKITGGSQCRNGLRIGNTESKQVAIFI